MKDIIYLIGGTLWILGFVLAKGFLSTLACIFAPYSWYLVVEYIWKIIEVRYIL